MLATLEADYIGRVLLTFLVSMVPVVELRGGIPFGTALGLDPVSAAVAAILGNLVPVPFIILFIRHIFDWLIARLPAGCIAAFTLFRTELQLRRVSRTLLWSLR